jgi:hypothetical protein
VKWIGDQKKTVLRVQSPETRRLWSTGRNRCHSSVSRDQKALQYSQTQMSLLQCNSHGKFRTSEKALQNSWYWNTCKIHKGTEVMGTFMNLPLSKVILEKMKADHSTWENCMKRFFSDYIISHFITCLMIPLCRNNTKELCPTDKYRELITAENSKLKVTKGIRKGIVKLSTNY